MTTCALPVCPEVPSIHYKKTAKHEELSLKRMFTQHPCGKQLLYLYRVQAVLMPIF
jgi:hypothetical protein